MDRLIEKVLDKKTNLMIKMVLDKRRNAIGNKVCIVCNKGDLKFSDKSLETAYKIFAVCEECSNDLSWLPNHF